MLVEIVWWLEIREREHARFLNLQGGLGPPFCPVISPLTQQQPSTCLPAGSERKHPARGSSNHVLVAFSSSLSAAARLWAMPLMGIRGYGTCYHSLRKDEAACALGNVGVCTIGKVKNCEQWEGPWSTGQTETQTHDSIGPPPIILFQC